MTTVPRLWPGSTIVCLGTGPSLTQEDVDLCRGRARVIAVNNAYRYAPWADVLYAADLKWWLWHKGVPEFAGLKYSIASKPPKWPVAQVLRNTGKHGLETQPTGLRTGLNSGYQAINLAVHLGARRIALLGYDMHGDHCFGSHPDKSKPPFPAALEAFPTLVQPMKDAGVELFNCTLGSAITCFPMAPLEIALMERAA